MQTHAGPPFPPPTRSPYPPLTGSPYPLPAGSPYPPLSGPTNLSPYPPPAGSFYPPPTGPPYSPPYPYGNRHQFNQNPPFAAPPYGSTSPQVNVDSQYSPMPSAPPLIEGYENMAFGVAGDGVPLFLPPPPMPTAPPPDTSHLFTFSSGNVTAEECREAFVKFADDHTCYGSSCAKDHSITQILPSNILHYQLETFTETRSVAYVNEPYCGGPIDGPNMEPVLGPWQIIVSPDSLFHDHVKKLPVPHTSSIQNCFTCDGRGRNICHDCSGSGRITCSSCSFRSSSSSPLLCARCNNTQRVTCNTCGGCGRKNCKKCDGHGKLKLYIQLTVNYINHQSDYVHQVTTMPNELIQKASGIVVTEQNEPQVWPITNYPVPEINTASKNLVEKHRTTYQGERQIRQRQKLRSIEVSEVLFTWKEHVCSYWVYGKERKVYCPEYPQKCCCTIV